VRFIRRFASAVLTCSIALYAQRFETASVREHRGNAIRSGPFQVNSTLITMEGYTVFGLVMDAWNVKDYQVKVRPDVPADDIFGAMYDIVARAPGGRIPTPDEARAMLRALLEERFRLQMHRETVERGGFALIAGKRTSPLQAHAGAETCSVTSRVGSDGRSVQETFRACPLDTLAERLTKLSSDRPVIDQTGMAGNYDFQFVRDPSDTGDVSASRAANDLGLRLVSRKVELEMIAVDRVAKPERN